MRLVIAVLASISMTAAVRADAFDNYTNDMLVTLTRAKGAQKIQKLTTEMMVERGRVLPGVAGTFLVVKNHEGRMSKLLVQAARQKISDDVSVPILLIDRLVTFQDGEERAIHVARKEVRLFADFHFDADMGQVVPAKLGGDMKFIVKGNDSYVEPVGKAEMYLVTEHLPEANPKKLARPEIGAKFEPRFFEGVYKLYDDGRRSGTLHLKVDAKNDVLGVYYSDKDGRKYEVAGHVGKPAHAIEFRITLPRTVQFFQGWMFTGDGRAIAGSSRLQERETGFYALRVDK